MAKRSMINFCVYGVPPSPVYKGVEERRAGPLIARPGGVLLPPGVGFPPSLVGLGEKEGGEREEGKGAPPPFLVQFGPEGEGARGLPWLPLSLSPL